MTYYSISNRLNKTKTRSTSPKPYNITLYKPTQTFNYSDVNINRYSKYRTYGDHFGEKETEYMQIVSQNINC